MQWPTVIFGTSGLGNLYTAVPQATKRSIVGEIFKHSDGIPVFDTAGKYGAGLALEALGDALRYWEIDPDDVWISNKLGWLQTDLKGVEPTFEPGVWKDLTHDAVQSISYDGIMACFEQGETLLNGYRTKLLSVHDPDEYLLAAKGPKDQEKRYQDILEAYRALHQLKKEGRIEAIGIGAKDWRVIERISQDVALDWVMIANSMTIYNHPAELIAFMNKLENRGVHIINSAVFNGGFLVGADYYNYRALDAVQDAALFDWRSRFFALCEVFKLQPVAVCIAFGLKAPGVKSIALNTTNAKRVEQNLTMVEKHIPTPFWLAMQEAGLLNLEVSFLEFAK